MQIQASDFHNLYQPSYCERRVYLAASGSTPAPPGPYAETLRRLGERHEAAHVASFPGYCNIAAFPASERVDQTLAAISRREPVIYHPRFQKEHLINRRSYQLVGEPDLLLEKDGSYVIQEVKISRRMTEADHPEALRQLELYGWMYEQIAGKPPRRLEVILGHGGIMETPYDHGARALETVGELARLAQLKEEPYSPVGWSKCLGCGFRGRCWPRAEKNQEVALIADLDQGLARALKSDGIETIVQFANRFNPGTLAVYSRPWGTGLQKVGKRAPALLLNAQAWLTGREIIIQKPDLPARDSFCMFDLEGIPPQLDELQKIYLWGLQVTGKNAGPYAPAVAGFGDAGDREGWFAFLNQAQAIFDQHGDIPFVHWSAYEKTNLALYLKRYGDPEGIARRVLDHCLDALPIAKAALALPLPSYSLKVIEKYIGYHRSMEEYGGDWSMAKYIEAVETGDEAERQKLMQLILKYNQEDLEAMWAVLQWLRSK